MPRCYLVKKNATKYPEETQESERKTPGPKSPTEATTAPTSPGYYRSMDATTNITSEILKSFPRKQLTGKKEQNLTENVQISPWIVQSESDFALKEEEIPFEIQSKF